MIYNFKRTIKNDCESFLVWFLLEIKNNARFKHIYYQVLHSQNFNFLIGLWDEDLEEEEVTNRVEMKFEAAMV